MSVPDFVEQPKSHFKYIGLGFNGYSFSPFSESANSIVTSPFPIFNPSILNPGIVLDTRLWVTRAGGLLAPISPSYQQAGSNMKRRRDQFLNFLLLLFLTRAIKMEIRHGVVIPFDLWTRPLCQPLASGHCSRLGSSTASSGCVHYSLICTSASSCQQTDWQ